MRVTLSILLILTLAGAYALGRVGGLRGPSAGSAKSSGASGQSRSASGQSRSASGQSGRESEPDLSSLASFRASFEQPDALERSYRFHGFLRTLSPDEVGEASEVLEARRTWLVEDELPNFMIAWTGFEAPAAFEWALSRSGPFREQASAAALEAWAFHDPVAARLALESVDPGVAAGSLREYLVAGWLKGGHHDGVIEYITSQPPGTERQRYTNLLTIELMRDGADAVIRWAESIPDDAPGAYKTMAFQKAAHLLAVVDPVHASRWIEAHLRQDYAAKAPSVVGRRWLEVDPPAALAWLASLPPGDASDQALRATLRAWLNESQGDAEAWVRANAETGGGSAAIKVMITRHAQDPPTAIGWAQQIVDPADRYRTMVRLARVWHRRDPAASEQWLGESELPPRMRAAILRTSPNSQSHSDDGSRASEAGGASPQPTS